MTESFPPDSPDAFFHDRRDWFRMDVMPTEHGNWAVVLVLDEGYSRESAVRVSRRFAWQIAKALADVFRRDDGTTSFRRWLGQGAGIADLAADHLAEEKRKEISVLDGLGEPA